MSNAKRFDLTREELLERYHHRIQTGSRTKLSSDEMGQLALHFVDRLQELHDPEQIQNLCTAEIELLEKGYPQSSIGSQYLPLYRRLIKEAIDKGSLPLTEPNSHLVEWTKRSTGETGQSQEHYALTFLKYDLGTYTKLRQQTTLANNERQDNLQAVPLEEYLDKATQLLHSEEPESLAITLAALTGRRHTEVVAKGQFQRTAYPYMLRFEGQQKDPTPPFDILTLLPAEEVIDSISRFRAMPKVRSLAGLGHSSPSIDAFNSRVNRRVAKYFQGIVPVLDGFKNVSIHRLRGVYGAIALHFFCPENQNEHRFLQHYLGHLLEEQKGRTNATATQHYFHYRLLDPDGSILTARGILIPNNGLPPETVEKTSSDRTSNEDVSSQLGILETSIASTPNSDVEEMNAICPPEAKSSHKSTKPCPHRQNTKVPNISKSELETRAKEKPIMHDELSFPIPERDQTRWLLVLDQICPEARSPEQKMTALLSWVEQHLKDSLGRNIGDSNDRLPSPNPDASSTGSDRQNETTLPNSVLMTLTDQAKVSAWLTNQLDLLERKLTEMRLERDRLPEQLSALKPHDDATETLTRENQFLKQELEREKAKLDSLRQLLNGTQSELKNTPTPETLAQPSSNPLPSAASQINAAPLPDPASKSEPIQKKKPPVQSSVSTPAQRTGKANARALKIFSALQQWNQQNPDNTFALTTGLLEETFGINRKAAKDFINKNHPEIQQHHQAVGIKSERSHNRGKDFSLFKDFILAQQ